MEKHQSYYMVIPAGIWEAPITARAMILYGHIMVLTNKKKYCYATNAYFEKVMKSSSSSIKRAMKELEDNNLIIREVYYKENSKEIEERKIFLNLGMVKSDLRAVVIDDLTPGATVDPDNKTRLNKTRSNSKLDVASVDIDTNKVIDIEEEAKAKIFFKIVDMYPKNRIGNRQHGLKKFKALDINQAKLAALNLKRYLKVAGTYTKNLQNYITEECYTEAWLQLEETKSNNKDITNTKIFKATYDDLD